MKTTTFIVIGRGEFPIDMLRYDSAYPVTEDDSRVIGQRTYEWDRGVLLQHRGVQKDWEPTLGRWKSFGWIPTVRTAS